MRSQSEWWPLNPLAVADLFIFLKINSQQLTSCLHLSFFNLIYIQWDIFWGKYPVRYYWTVQLIALESWFLARNPLNHVQILGPARTTYAEAFKLHAVHTYLTSKQIDRANPLSLVFHLSYKHICDAYTVYIQSSIMTGVQLSISWMHSGELSTLD